MANCFLSQVVIKHQRINWFLPQLDCFTCLRRLAMTRNSGYPVPLTEVKSYQDE
jgi:hypothetical protein